MNESRASMTDITKAFDFLRLEQRAMLRNGLEDHKSPFSTSEAVKRENVSKNRYNDIVPYNGNRVRLSTRQDYINASFINGTEIIASQGPLPETVPDFWQMVWDTVDDVVHIIQLSPWKENGMDKCAPYFHEVGETTSSNDVAHFRVRLISTVFDPTCNSQVTELGLYRESIQTGKEIAPHLPVFKRVVHLRFLGWPDHGVPKTTEPITNLIRLVHTQKSQLQSKGPTIVHCSAGCGRTGTFIALMMLMNAEGNSDILSLVQKLREQRIAMVESPSQLAFLYDYQASKAG